MFLMQKHWNLSIFGRGDVSLTNPFRILSFCFGVIGKTPGLVSCNNFVEKKKKIVYIGHREIILARCESNVAFAQVSSSVAQNMHTTFFVLNPLSEPKQLQDWRCSKILLSFLMRLDGLFDQICSSSKVYISSVDFGWPPLSSFSTSSLPSRNQEYHLNTFDLFTASFP